MTAKARKTRNTRFYDNVGNHDNVSMASLPQQHTGEPHVDRQRPLASPGPTTCPKCGHGPYNVEFHMLLKHPSRWRRAHDRIGDVLTDLTPLPEILLVATLLTALGI